MLEYSAIQGEKGEQGIQGIQGIQGEQGEPGNDGKTPLLMADDNSKQIKVSYDNGDTYANLLEYSAIQGEKGEQGIQGIQGTPGNDGKTPLLMADDNSKQIKVSYDNGDTYANLLEYSAIQGEKGEQGIQGIQGTPGNDGKTPLLMADDNSKQIKVSYDNGDTYANLLEYSAIQGEKGEQGIQGIQGPQGEKGNDGVSPTIQMDGNTIQACYGDSCTDVGTISLANLCTSIYSDKTGGDDKGDQYTMYCCIGDDCCQGGVCKPDTPVD